MSVSTKSDLPSWKNWLNVNLDSERLVPIGESFLLPKFHSNYEGYLDLAFFSRLLQQLIQKWPDWPKRFRKNAPMSSYGAPVLRLVHLYLFLGSVLCLPFFSEDASKEVTAGRFWAPSCKQSATPKLRGNRKAQTVDL